MVKKLSSEFSSHMALAFRSAMVEFMVNHPSATLGELLALDKGLRHLSVAEIMDAKSEANRHATPSRGGSASSRRPLKTRQIDTRTAAGRVAFDASVLATIQQVRGKVGAETLRVTTGGDSHQVRRALGRLVRENQVKRSGRARSTLYEAR